MSNGSEFVWWPMAKNNLTFMLQRLSHGHEPYHVRKTTYWPPRRRSTRWRVDSFWML